MSLTADNANFSAELSDILNEYSEKAFSNTFNRKLVEGHSLEAAIKSISEDFAKEFAKAGPRIADAIDKHIKKAQVIAVLSNTAGSVTGKIEIT